MMMMIIVIFDLKNSSFKCDFENHPASKKNIQFNEWMMRTRRIRQMIFGFFLVSKTCNYFRLLLLLNNVDQKTKKKTRNLNVRFWSNEKKTTTQIFIFFNTNLTKLSTMKIFNKMTHTCCSSSYRFHSIKKVLSNKKNNSTVKSFYWIFVLVLYQSLPLIDWLIDGLNRNLNGSIMVRGEDWSIKQNKQKKIQ